MPDRACKIGMDDQPMRKLLEALTLLAIATLLYLTWTTLYGPHRLTGPIPTRFDTAGHAIAYAPASSLFILPAIALVLYALMTAISRFPSAFNYPVRVTQQTLPILQNLSLSLIAWLKLEITLLFTLIQYEAIHAIHTGRIPPALMPASLIAIFATILLYYRAMRRQGPPLRRR